MGYPLYRYNNIRLRKGVLHEKKINRTNEVN
jgi:hypothetical protein